MTRLPRELVKRIRQQAGQRCGYCRCPQRLLPAPLEIEHIIPRSKDGTDDETNLWLACATCNSHKSDKTHAVDPITGDEVALFNPRTESWNAHFVWTEDGLTLRGLTPTGRATIAALKINDDPHMLVARAVWVQVGLHPDK